VTPLLGRSRATVAGPVTVVVGVTDGNAPYLGECVGALTAQERRPDEVLLAVQGGSGVGADTAAAVSAALSAAADAGLRATALDGGLADGADRVTAGMVMFLEAGDLIVPTAVQALAGTLDETGSDLALAGGEAAVRSTVVSAPQALAGADLPVMMMRADFWRSTGLDASAEPLLGWLPAVRAVLSASAFDVVTDQVRRGRRRGTGVAFSAMTGVAPHLSRLLPLVETVVGELATDELRAAREHLTRRLLSSEVSAFLDEAEHCDAGTWQQLVAFVRLLLADLPDVVLAAVPVEPRLRAWLAAEDRLADLASFNAQRWHEDDFPTRADDGRVLAVLPVDGAPDPLLELSTDEAPLVTQLRRARWSAHDTGPLELDVVAFTRRLGAEAGLATLRAALVSDTDVHLDLTVQPLHAPEIDLMAAEAHHDQADGMWRVSVDSARLLAAGPATWSLQVGWERAGVRRAGTVRDVERRGSAAALPARGADRHEVALDLRTARLVVRPARPPDPVPPVPEITGLDLDGDVLTVAGTAPDGRHVLRLRGPRAATSIPVQVADGSFTARLPLRHDPWSLGEVGLPVGSYRLRLQPPEAQPADGRPDGRGRLLLEGDAVGRTPYFLRSSDVRVRVERNPDGSAQLVLAPPLADDEAGPRAQHGLRRWYASDEHRVDPRRVFLQSYNGLSATDSPLAIHRELRRSRPDLRLVWSAADASIAVPEGAERVLLRSREWFAAMATCGHIVTNIDLDEWFHKRPGQRVLQTFHGYPAKAMGVMAWEAKNFTPSVVERHLRRTSATWDLLLTPHPSMDVHYREQYRYDGPILSAGYPRDDELVGPDAARIREEARERLGIGDRTAVLYAPTWRDDLTTSFRAAAMPSTFDVESAARALGEDHVILMRGHRFHRQRPEVRGRLLDVTGYPEINHLVLAADAAVLDYSSLRFDVALTRRPMIFLVPDLGRYESDVRGFLYDFRTSAPGPLVDSTAEVVEALRDLPGLIQAHRDDYERFHLRFNALQDGHSAERVVAAFFGASPPQR
jgi:CDP-glycerol glycerophosphotransferase (TagB/SpsB family)